jgi:hypothetical protein
VAAGAEEPSLGGTVHRIDPGNGAKVLWIEK